jgi:hypothetical protein
MPKVAKGKKKIRFGYLTDRALKICQETISELRL